MLRPQACASVVLPQTIPFSTLPTAMSKLRQTLGGYFWWTYPRGSVPYDIMVTLILAFIFLAPLAINFGDKPTVRAPHQTETVVRPDGNGFLYKVDAAAVNEGSDSQIRESLLRVLEPISGEITIDHYQAVRDSKDKVIAYQVWAHR
jgi:hypothetical protein